MATCNVCGNDYDRPLIVRLDGREYVFDSLECAAHRLAPTCRHCGCRIMGHGMQAGDRIYCCAHCARVAGVEGLDDRT
jgi:hypothetical protein